MKLLWVKTNLLHPVNTGGAIRTYHMLRHLRAEHQITYLAPVVAGAEETMRQAGEYCDRLVTVPWVGAAQRTEWRFYAQALANLRSPLPLALERFAIPALGVALRDLVARESFDLAVCDFLFPALQFGEIVGTPQLLFQHNVETLIWERIARQSRGLARWYFRAQAQRMREWEGRLARRFGHVVVVSRKDAALMGEWFGTRNVTVVPTGVDAEFYRPAPQPAVGPDVVFVGSLDWQPNVDGLRWFVDAIWPVIRARRPDARFHVVGRRPTRAVVRATREQPGVYLWPDVPDVRERLNGAAVVVVPLRVGSGTRLKVYEALACGKAVIATTVGAEGLEVIPGKHFVLADDSSSFADAVLALLNDPARRRALGEAGRELVAHSFTWRHAAAAFTEACEQAVRTREAVRR